MIKKIINFLNRDEIKILSQYWKFNKKNMIDCDQSIGSLKKYGDPISESILLIKKTLLEEVVG